MWEYVKGSEADFRGYSDTTFQIRKRHDNGLKFGTDGKPSRADWLSDVIAERLKVDNLQSRVNDVNLQQIVKLETAIPSKEERDAYNKRFDRVDMDELMAAKHTLEEKGYKWRGGQLWAPPIGPVPAFIQTEALIAERGTRYGEFKDGAAIMQQLKDVMKGAPKWEALKPSQKEALEMIQHKIGRILNGDPDYDDNWKDIAGYATLIVKELSK